MKSATIPFIGVSLVWALAGPSALAQTSNFWGTNVNVASYTGNYNDTNHWSSGTKPVSLSESVLFTNNRAPAYTVTFTGSEQNGPLYVDQDKVIFDLAGHTWSNNVQVVIGGSSPADVTFTSTGPAGQVVTPNSFWGTPTTVGVGSVLTVTNVDLYVGDGGNLALYGTTRILGPNARIYQRQTYNTEVAGIVDVADGAKFHLGNWTTLALGSSSSLATTVTVHNASLLDFEDYYTDDFVVVLIGQGYSGVMSVTSNSQFNMVGLNSGVAVGNNRVYSSDPWMGQLLIDNSSASLNGVVVGHDYYPYTQGNGKLTVQNGSTLVLSNGYLIVNDMTHMTANGYTNTLVLNNSTIQLGGRPGVNGVLTNRGIVRANGVIRGAGAGPALVRSEALLEVGSSIGTLVLSNANLELAAGSQTLFEFSDTGLDQINVVGGWASLDGTNLFSLADGSALPTPGVKWGLGAYDFVLGTGVTAGANFYANMTNLLGGYYLVENVDYRFGIMDLGGGLQALRLEFVPEPSTFWLLLGGAWLVVRLRPARRA